MGLTIEQSRTALLDWHKILLPKAYARQSFVMLQTGDAQRLVDDLLDAAMALEEHRQAAQVVDDIANQLEGIAICGPQGADEPLIKDLADRLRTVLSKGGKTTVRVTVTDGRSITKEEFAAHFKGVLAELDERHIRRNLEIALDRYVGKVS